MRTVDPLTGKIGKPAKFRSAVSHRVSKRPIWLGDAATSEAALPPRLELNWIKTTRR